MIYYKQCAVHKNGITFFFWIPEEYAKKNKKLQMKVNNNWDKGWKVLRVFNVRLEEEKVKKDEWDLYIAPNCIREDK